MKVKEIVNEASWSDLVDAGKKSQLALYGKLGKAIANKVAGSVSKLPGIKQALAKYAQLARTAEQKKVVTVASKLVNKWDQDIAPHRNKLTVENYQHELQRWLSTEFKQRISLSGIQDQIQTKNSAAVLRYLIEFVLPDYYGFNRPQPSAIPPVQPEDAVVDPQTGQRTTPGGIQLT